MTPEEQSEFLLELEQEHQKVSMLLDKANGNLQLEWLVRVDNNTSGKPKIEVELLPNYSMKKNVDINNE